MDEIEKARKKFKEHVESWNPPLSWLDDIQGSFFRTPPNTDELFQFVCSTFGVPADVVRPPIPDQPIIVEKK